MKLRWKFFFILLTFSLVPLIIITIVSQRGTRRMETEISADVQQRFARLAAAILKRTAENSAALVELGRKSFELAMAGIADEAQAALTEDPPSRVNVYFASDFDDPATMPPDAGPHPGYVKRSPGERGVEEVVSFEHPSALIAPGVSVSEAADDIDRLSLLTDAFVEISAKLGPALHWVYVSSESGVHFAFPGHGGYPEGYDPRQRPWYAEATDEMRWSPPLVDATSGQVIMTLSKLLRNRDGSRAGVVAMDVLLTEVLRSEALASLFTADMQSMLVTPVHNPQSQASDLLVIAQRKYQAQGASWDGALIPEPLSTEDPAKTAELAAEIAAGRSGYLEMPYHGVPSLWAFSPVHPKATFLMIVPREVTDRLPEKTLAAVRSFASDGRLTTALTALGAIVLAILGALAGSRGFTRIMYALADAAGRLSRGDFSVRLHLRAGDERDQVVQAFNDMVPKLEDHLRMHKSLLLATEVQQSLLPKTEPSLPGLDIAGISHYCDETGGDYYDYLEIPKDPLGAAAVVVGDVSGHGVHAALLMASARAALRLRASLPGGPAEIIADVNRQFTTDVNGSGAFMTLFYLAIDSTRVAARWVRAGHDPAILYDPDSGRFEEFWGQGAPLGIDADAVFEEREKRNLHSGAIIFIGTDGIWETAGPDGRLFGKDALRDLIRATCELSAREITKAVVQTLEAFRKGLKPSDDITMVVIKIL